MLHLYRMYGLHPVVHANLRPAKPPKPFPRMIKEAEAAAAAAAEGADGPPSPSKRRTRAKAKAAQEAAGA